MTLLSEKLKARISQQGPLTFREFMQSALYDVDLGYYNTERVKIGPAGDYYTSSNVHAAFGASLASLFASLLVQLGADGARSSSAGDPATHDHHMIMEVGAGTGQLAHDILTALSAEHPRLYSRIKYVIAERSSAMETRQREKLSAYSEKVEWRGVSQDGHPNVDTIDGIVFSNELIDAMPVHVVRAGEDGLQELYVTCNDGSDSTSEEYLPIAKRSASSSEHDSESSGLSTAHLCFTWGTPSCEEIHQYVDRMGVALSEGQVIEINLDAVDWLRAVASFLGRGWLVTIDYGDIASHLYGADRRRGTLRAFHKHTIAASVLDRVGEQDITSSVNFTALMEYGRDEGFDTVSLERQSAFLVRMGLIDRIAGMQVHADVLTDLKNRIAIKNLFVPGGASDNFRVLIQSRA